MKMTVHCVSQSGVQNATDTDSKNRAVTIDLDASTAMAQA